MSSDKRITISLKGGAVRDFQLSGGWKTPLKIFKVVKGSPAQKQGIQAGDILISVNDTSVSGKGQGEALKLIEKSQTPVRLVVSRRDFNEVSPGKVKSSTQVLSTGTTVKAAEVQKTVTEGGVSVEEVIHMSSESTVTGSTASGASDSEAGFTLTTNIEAFSSTTFDANEEDSSQQLSFTISSSMDEVVSSGDAVLESDHVISADVTLEDSQTASTVSLEVADSVSNPQVADSVSNPQVADSVSNPQVADSVSNTQVADSVSIPQPNPSNATDLGLTSTTGPTQQDSTSPGPTQLDTPEPLVPDIVESPQTPSPEISNENEIPPDIEVDHLQCSSFSPGQEASLKASSTLVNTSSEVISATTSSSQSEQTLVATSSTSETTSTIQLESTSAVTITAQFDSKSAETSDESSNPSSESITSASRDQASTEAFTQADTKSSTTSSVGIVAPSPVPSNTVPAVEPPALEVASTAEPSVKSNETSTTSSDVGVTSSDTEPIITSGETPAITVSTSLDETSSITSLTSATEASIPVDETSGVAALTSLDETSATTTPAPLDDTSAVATPTSLDETSAPTSSTPVDETSATARRAPLDETSAPVSSTPVDKTPAMPTSTPVDETLATESLISTDEAPAIPTSTPVDETPATESLISIDETPAIPTSAPVDETPAIPTSAPVDETPATESLISIDETPAIPTSKPVDETPATESLISIDETPAIPTSAPVDETPATESLISTDETPAIPTSAPVDETPAIPTAAPVDETPAIPTSAPVDETPAIPTSAPVDETPATESLIAIDETPAIPTSAPVDETPATEFVISVDEAPAIPTSTPVDETPATEFVISVDEAPAIPTSAPVDETPAIPTSAPVDETPATQSLISIDDTSALIPSISIDETAVAVSSTLVDEAPAITATDEKSTVPSSSQVDETSTITPSTTLDVTPVTTSSLTSDRAPPVPIDATSDITTATSLHVSEAKASCSQSAVLSTTPVSLTSSTATVVASPTLFNTTSHLTSTTTNLKLYDVSSFVASILPPDKASTTPSSPSRDAAYGMTYSSFQNNTQFASPTQYAYDGSKTSMAHSTRIINLDTSPFLNSDSSRTFIPPTDTTRALNDLLNNPFTVTKAPTSAVISLRNTSSFSNLSCTNYSKPQITMPTGTLSSSSDTWHSHGGTPLFRPTKFTPGSAKEQVVGQYSSVSRFEVEKENTKPKPLFQVASPVSGRAPEIWRPNAWQPGQDKRHVRATSVTSFSSYPSVAPVEGNYPRMDRQNVTRTTHQVTHTKGYQDSLQNEGRNYDSKGRHTHEKLHAFGPPVEFHLDSGYQDKPYRHPNDYQVGSLYDELSSPVSVGMSKDRNVYSDSAFYDTPGQSYPTIPEQMKLCKKIAQSLTSTANRRARGAKMFMKRKRKSSKWVHLGIGEFSYSDEDVANLQDLDSDSSSDEEEFNSDLYFRLSDLKDRIRFSKPIKMALTPVQFEELRLNARKCEHTAITPELCFDIVADLKAHKGRGGRLFERRKKRSDKFIIDDTNIKTMTPSTKLDVILSHPPRKEITPWQAAMSHGGNVDAAFSNLSEWEATQKQQVTRNPTHTAQHQPAFRPTLTRDESPNVTKSANFNRTAKGWTSGRQSRIDESQRHISPPRQPGIPETVQPTSHKHEFNNKLQTWQNLSESYYADNTAQNWPAHQPDEREHYSTSRQGDRSRAAWEADSRPEHWSSNTHQVSLSRSWHSGSYGSPGYGNEVDWRGYSNSSLAYKQPIIPGTDL